ncbi:hypothetical protein K4Q18_03140, partial [Staphylococcus epidermidis]|nr:hypothetical protein [Staphylococcus epidermidis]
MKKIKNSYKIRIKYFLILITLMVIYYWFSKLDNPYIQFYNSETIHYFINTICKQYIHILSFAIQSSLCAFIIAFFKSSPDSCVKCYTMFLPFLLIKIDVFS